MPATEIEAAVVEALAEHRKHGARLENSNQRDPANALAEIARIEVRKSALMVWLKGGGADTDDDADPSTESEQARPLLIPWTKSPSKRFKEILVPADGDRQRVRPIRFERRAALLKSIARGRAWLDGIVSGARPSRASLLAQMQHSPREHDDLDGICCTRPG